MTTRSTIFLFIYVGYRLITSEVNVCVSENVKCDRQSNISFFYKICDGSEISGNNEINFCSIEKLSMFRRLLE